MKVNWYYNEKHRGKSPMDGAGGTSKSIVSRDVMSYICVIENAKAFAQYANRVANRISSIYKLESE